jgi:hypothetical protein
VHDAAPKNWGNNLTILGALSCHGPEAVLTGAGATGATVLRTFVEEMLAPTVRPDDSVVRDNLGAHKVNGVATAIPARGARLAYWPPSSPDWSPIEPGWSKLQTYWRATKARPYEALHQALARAIDRATPADAGGGFAPCGYALH